VGRLDFLARSETPTLIGCEGVGKDEVGRLALSEVEMMKDERRAAFALSAGACPEPVEG